ncbi:hypothetical protein ACFL3X_00910 [Gemmatimonadota bacterium]
MSRPEKRWIVLCGLVLTIALGLLAVPKPGWLQSGDYVNASVQQIFDIPESERRHIGVLDLKTYNLSREEVEQAQSISEQLRLHLGQLGLFEVIDRSRMTSIMEEVGFQYGGAEDTSASLTNIGEIMGVTEMLGGSVSKAGSLYSLQVRLIDVVTSGVIACAFIDVTNLTDVLESGVDQVVQSLGSAVYSRMQSSLDEAGHFTFSPDLDRVGVMRLECYNVPQGVADAVTERLGIFLGRSTFAYVLERDSIEDILKVVGFQARQTPPGDIDHAVGISRILKAKKVITGMVLQAGESYSLQIRVIDINSSSTEYDAIADVGTVEELLLSAPYSVVNQLEDHYRDR